MGQLAPIQELAVQRIGVLVNRRGLHARAAAKIATLSERYAATLEVSYDGQTVPASSIMGLMLLGAGCGAELILSGEGPDAEIALDSLCGLVTSGFDEGE